MCSSDLNQTELFDCGRVVKDQAHHARSRSCLKSLGVEARQARLEALARRREIPAATRGGAKGARIRQAQRFGLQTARRVTHASHRGKIMQSIGSNDHVDKIWSLAKYVRVAMMTTWHSGEIAARPMYSIINDDEKVVWFIAERHSAKVHVAQREPEALLTFSNGTGGDHLVMNGDLDRKSVV